MNSSMRLINRNGWWHVEIDRTTRRSLHTRDEALARRRFEKLERQALAGKLFFVEHRFPLKRLGAFAEEYLEHVAQTKRPLTYTAAAWALRRALPWFGPETPLAAISPRQVDAWLGGLGRELKPGSVNTCFRFFKAALSQAVAWKYLRENPCRGVKQLPVEESEPRYLTQEQFRRFLTTEPDPDFRRFWELAVRTGCRRSELLSLTAEAIDWQLGIFTITRTKNRRLKRVPLSAAIGAILRQVPVQVGKLFPWQPNSVSHHFKKTARAAGLPRIRLHDLRHSYCSWLVQAGVDLQIVKELAGHRDLRTTEHYARLLNSQLAQAQDKIDLGID